MARKTERKIQLNSFESGHRALSLEAGLVPVETLRLEQEQDILSGGR